jgi:hypothetical protein
MASGNSRTLATVDPSITGVSFPVEAVSALELEREPHIHKASVGQDDTQFVDIGDNRLDDDVDKLHLSDLTQPLDIDQTHTTAARSGRIRPQIRLATRRGATLTPPAKPATLAGRSLHR